MHIARYEIDGPIHFGALEGNLLKRFSGSPFTSSLMTGDIDHLDRVHLLCPVEAPRIFGAGLNYVGTGIAKHRIQRVVLAHAPGATADDDRKLALEVNVLALARIGRIRGLLQRAPRAPLARRHHADATLLRIIPTAHACCSSPIRLGGALSRPVSHADSSLSTNRLGQAHGANYCGPQAFASKHHFSRIAQFAERRS